MTTSHIPAWTADGVLPPIDLAAPTSPARSPYRVSLTDFVLRFATSAERIGIIDGVLRYWQKLHAIGLIQGFQWIDGSFLENVEVLETRPPRDVDVVTFFHLPTGETQASIFARDPGTFDHAGIKAGCFVDAYPLDLAIAAQDLVSTSAYWYGVWSHQRGSLLWKGFVEVDLHPGDDVAARGVLTGIQTVGVSP